MNNKTDINSIFEAYAVSKPLTENHSHMQEVEAERRAQEEERRNEIAAEIGPDPDDVDRRDAEEEEGEGNIFERLEAFMHSNPEAEQELTPILNDFQDIIEDINSLDVDDYKVDVTDLGIHLNRLFPDV
jgi:hypothetical protein